MRSIPRESVDNSFFVVGTPLSHVRQDWNKRAAVSCKPVSPVVFAFLAIFSTDDLVFLEIAKLGCQHFLRDFGSFTAKLSESSVLLSAR